MKKDKVIIMILFVIFSLTPTLPLSAEKIDDKEIIYLEEKNLDDIVEVPDKELKRIINEQLGKAADSDITKLDMLELDELNLNNQPITDLTGLEYAENLYILDISNTGVTDLTPLRYIADINTLDISNTRVTDLTPLGDLSSIYRLDISNTEVTDLTPLENTMYLQNLDMSNTEVTNIAPLENVWELNTLNISATKVTDLTPLNKINTLNAVYADNMEIKDFSFLSDPNDPGVGTRLEAVSLKNNKLNNNDILNLASSVGNSETCLYLGSNHISDLRPLQDKIITGDYRCDSAGGERNVIDQTIKLDDIEVFEDKKITYNVYNSSGNTQEVVLATTLNPGLNKLSGNWNMYVNDDAKEWAFTGVVSQEVFYNVLKSNVKKEIKEENPLTDAELIDLFEVKSPETTSIMVDQSGVNYSVPGEYTVVFTQNDSAGNLIGKQTVTLVIEDVLPIITSEEAELTINLGDEKPDYIKAYKANATEITENDLSDKLYVDDSWVDYNKTGEYTVVLRVRDEETNTTSMAVKLNIVRDVTKPADPLTPELGKDKPDNPDTLTPEVDVERPKNPDTLTPEIDQEKPEVVDPINPEEPEVVDPINPEKPEVADPINPEVTIPKEEEEGLKDTGKQLPVIGLTLSVLSLFVIYVTKKNIA